MNLCASRGSLQVPDMWLFVNANSCYAHETVAQTSGYGSVVVLVDGQLPKQDRVQSKLLAFLPSEQCQRKSYRVGV